MINEFEISWVKTPVEDTLGIGSLGFQCDYFCVVYGPDTCGLYCEKYTS